MSQVGKHLLTDRDRDEDLNPYDVKAFLLQAAAVAVPPLPPQPFCPSTLHPGAQVWNLLGAGISSSAPASALACARRLFLTGKRR